MGWNENRLRPTAVGRNQKGTFDLGAFQINSLHLPSLAKYGMDRTDGCTSVDVAAWCYRKQVDAYGNTWFAVGVYHSRTPARAGGCANQIARQLMPWQVAAAGPLPLPAKATLLPGAPARVTRGSRAAGAVTTAPPSLMSASTP